MNKYEILYIIHPDLTEEAMTEEAEKYKAMIEADGGEVSNLEKWGKRKLAYEVKKQREGYYVLMNVVAKPETVNNLDRVFKISETVIRQLILREDEE